MALMQVAVTKGGSAIEINTDELPEDVYAEALLQGLKVLLNRSASKITKETYPNEDERKAAAMKKAEEQKVLCMTTPEQGKAGAARIKFTGQKASKKASGAVMTEARRLAKNLVKDMMKEQGIKVSHVDAKDITAAANKVLELKPELIEMAAENLKKREEVPAVQIDLSGLIPVNPDKKAKADAKKAKGGTISAKQAGMVAKRAKGEGKGQTAH